MYICQLCFEQIECKCNRKHVAVSLLPQVSLPLPQESLCLITQKAQHVQLPWHRRDSGRSERPADNVHRAYVTL